MNSYKTVFFAIGVLLIILGVFMIVPFFIQFIYDEKNGININAPNIIRSTPVAKKTVLLLFIFENGGYLKTIEIQHNKTLLYLYFSNEI